LVGTEYPTLTNVGVKQNLPPTFSNVGVEPNLMSPFTDYTRNVGKKSNQEPKPIIKPKPQSTLSNLAVVEPTTKTVSTETMDETINENNPMAYDSSLHYKTPKSELDIPLYVALRMTYPEQILKYRQDAERYGYFIDTELTDNEHLVLINPKKNITIFGVRGTNVENFNDIITNAATPLYGIKNLKRYKAAEKKNEEVKLKYKNNEIIKIGHSLGGLIQSVLSKEDEKVYTYNRPYSHPVKDNEIAISVETDPLYMTNKIDRKKIKTIPRIYYQLAKDYVGIEKAKVNPLYEQKPIEIPNKFKTDIEVVAYKNLGLAAETAGRIGYRYYTQQSQFQNLPILGFGLTTSYLSKRYSNSHALENLPLNIRIESSKKSKKK
jgi:hypothetical protein